MLCLDLVQELGELLWRKVDILLQWHLACQLLHTDVWYSFGVPNNTPKMDLAYTVKSTKDLLRLNKVRIIIHNSTRRNPQNVIRAKSQVKTLLMAWTLGVKVLLRNKEIQWLICNQKMKITSRGKTKPNFLSTTRVLVKFYHLEFLILKNTTSLTMLSNSRHSDAISCRNFYKPLLFCNMRFSTKFCQIAVIAVL
jgi:hypothetical protein